MGVAREAHRGVLRNNSAENESAEFSVLLDHPCQLLIITTFSWFLILSYFRLVFANIVLTTAGTANIVEPYLRSYAVKRAGQGCHALRHVFRNIFTKTSPCNAVIISVVETFLRSGTVLLCFDTAEGSFRSPSFWLYK